MAGTTGMQLAVAALGALAIIPSAALADGGRGLTRVDASTPKLTIAVATFKRGEVKGMISAVQRGEQRRAVVSVSVFGVGGGVDDQRVIASKRPCSKPHPGRAVFVLAMQDVFVTEVVQTNGPLGKARSVRVGGACRPLDVAVQFAGTSQEGTGIRPTADATGGLTRVDASTPKLTIAVATFKRGEVKGMISAVQRGDQRRAGVSVFGVGGGVDDERVVASKQPCSKARRGRAVFVLAMQDVFVTEVVATNGPLGKAKSVRVGGACRPLDVAVQFQGQSQEGTGI